MDARKNHNERKRLGGLDIVWNYLRLMYHEQGARSFYLGRFGFIYFVLPQDVVGESAVILCIADKLCNFNADTDLEHSKQFCYLQLRQPAYKHSWICKKLGQLSAAGGRAILHQ